MAFTVIADGPLAPDKPADTTLFTELADNDAWNKTAATASAEFFTETAYGTPGHTHTGAAGQGAQIPTAGMQSVTAGEAGAINAADMFAAGAVTNAKIASNTINGKNFADGAITNAKLSGTMGVRKFGSKNAGGPGGGTTETVYHGRGHRPVITNQVVTGVAGVDSIEFEIIDTTNPDFVIIGQIASLAADPWRWDFYVS